MAGAIGRVQDRVAERGGSPRETEVNGSRQERLREEDVALRLAGFKLQVSYPRSYCAGRRINGGSRLSYIRSIRTRN